jgi:hypothetical protein
VSQPTTPIKAATDVLLGIVAIFQILTPSRMFWMLAVAAVVPIALVGCGDDYRDANETDELNVYFYYPRDSDRPEAGVYLGQVTGISACRRAAGSFAASKNMTSRSGWSYICCRIAHGSSCYDKSK